MDKQVPNFLIVYNADGGLINMVKDGLWKILSPDTYPCSLCAVSYGPVSMRSEWRAFLKSLPNEVVIHHKDDFAEAYPGHDIALPAILLRDGDAMPKVLISNEELDAMENVEQLIALTARRLGRDLELAAA